MFRPPPPLFSRSSARGFTLLEMCIAVFIITVIIGMAVPSVSSVLAERRLRASLDAFCELAGAAQRRSVTEGKAYLVAWDAERNAVRLLPEGMPRRERRNVPAAVFPAPGNYSLSLPVALPDGAGPIENLSGRRNARATVEWAFWPTGNCEPATVRFEGPAGVWEAAFSPLTARPSLLVFQPK